VDSLSRLEGMMYVVEHDPSGRSPFIVRLAGSRQANIDKKPMGRTRDIIGLGKTLDEAIKAAISFKNGKLKHSCVIGSWECHPNKMPQGFCSQRMCKK